MFDTMPAMQRHEQEKAQRHTSNCASLSLGSGCYFSHISLFFKVSNSMSPLREEE
jgi:hypothetical protein